MKNKRGWVIVLTLVVIAVGSLSFAVPSNKRDATPEFLYGQPYRVSDDLRLVVRTPPTAGETTGYFEARVAGRWVRVHIADWDSSGALPAAN